MSAQFSDADDALLRQMAADGLDCCAMAARLSRPGRAVSYQQVNARLRNLAQAQRSTRRPCLCCGKVFLSAGPHNRLCSPCRHRPDAGDLWRYA